MCRQMWIFDGYMNIGLLSVKKEDGGVLQHVSIWVVTVA